MDSFRMGIAVRSDGVLEVADDDESIGGEESLKDGFHGCMFLNVLF